MATVVKQTGVEWVTELADQDLEDLCEATEEAILDGNGFGWLTPPPRRILESYWRGVMLVPERDLIVARLEGSIAGSAQLLRPPPQQRSPIIRCARHDVLPRAVGAGSRPGTGDARVHGAAGAERWLRRARS